MIVWIVSPARSGVVVFTARPLFSRVFFPSLGFGLGLIVGMRILAL